MARKTSHTAGHELLPAGAFPVTERMEQYSVRLSAWHARMGRRAGAGEGLSDGVRLAIEEWAARHYPKEKKPAI